MTTRTRTRKPTSTTPKEEAPTSTGKAVATATAHTHSKSTPEIAYRVEFYQAPEGWKATAPELNLSTTFLTTRKQARRTLRKLIQKLY